MGVMTVPVIDPTTPGPTGEGDSDFADSDVAASEVIEAGARRSMSDVLAKMRAIKGAHVIAILLLVNSAFLLLNIVSARHNRSVDEQRQRDAVVIRDVGRVTEVWKKLPDGMVLRMTPVVANDDATVKVIRRTMKWQRTRYLGGDYSDAKFDLRDIPGRANLEFGSSNGLLNVRYRDLPDGGELHWITTDSVMIDSLNEWGTNVATGEFPNPLKAPASVVTTTTVPSTTVPVTTVPVTTVPSTRVPVG
jgi:hypothetical protein